MISLLENKIRFLQMLAKMLDKNKIYFSFKPRINHIERVNTHISEAFSRLGESRHDGKVF